MKVLVINAGSSSLKYQLIDMTDESVLAKGNCERIGTEGSFIGFKTPDGEKIERKAEMKNHTQAFEAVKNALLDAEYGAIKDLSEVTAIGHRVVQGGAYFDRTVLIDADVLEKIRSFFRLLPCTIPLIFRASTPAPRFSARTFPRLRYLTRLSIRQCPKRLICSPFPMSIMKSTA